MFWERGIKVYFFLWGWLLGYVLVIIFSGQINTCWIQIVHVSIPHLQSQWGRWILAPELKWPSHLLCTYVSPMKKWIQTLAMTGLDFTGTHTPPRFNILTRGARAAAIQLCSYCNLNVAGVFVWSSLVSSLVGAPYPRLGMYPMGLGTEWTSMALLSMFPLSQNATHHQRPLMKWACCLNNHLHRKFYRWVPKHHQYVLLVI